MPCRMSNRHVGCHRTLPLQPVNAVHLPGVRVAAMYHLTSRPPLARILVGEAFHEPEPSKGPGRATRKGLSVIEMTKLFPSDEAAEAWFVETRWPGLECPHCDSDNVATVKSRKPMPYRPDAASISASAPKRSCTQVWAIACLMTTGINRDPASPTRRPGGSFRDENPAFTGPVDTWAGKEQACGQEALRRWRHRGQDAGRWRQGPPTGRVSARPTCDVVPDTTGPTLRTFVRRTGALIHRRSAGLSCPITRSAMASSG